MASRSAFGREKSNTMPGTSRTQQKAEARYNVTTQFPQYELHFAAASGNLGLVQFALSHGQPINSVLNGVLPLHAACAGGSEIIVKYLIDEGADVNAPRYSNEKHKSSGLAVGASGSTPLHFAAANGHMSVVRLLLAHGAVPDRADKHGVTPEMLARENGWVECADILASWSGGRAGDLPPVMPGEAFGSNSGFGSGNANEMGNLEKEGCEIVEMIQSGSRRLHVKRSIDNALHLFKAPLALHHHGSHGQLRERDRTPPSPSSAAHPHSFLSSHFHHSYSQSNSNAGSPAPLHIHSIFHHAHLQSTSQLQSQSQSQSQSNSTSGSGASTIMNANTHQNMSTPNTGAPPSPSGRALGEYTFYPTASPTTSVNPNPIDGLPAYRRPSLPQIFDEPASPFQRCLSERKRRPRSAGSDAEQDGNGNGVNGAKALANGYNGGNGATIINTNSNTNTISARKLSSKISLRNLFRRAGGDASASLSLSGSEPGSGSVSASTSFSASSAPIYNHAFASVAPSVRGSASPTPPASPLSASFAPSPAPMTGAGAGVGTWYRARLGSENAVPVPRSPLVPSAVELHHRYSQDQLREEFQEEAVPEAVGDFDAPVAAPRLSARPSILRGHNRSSSSQSSGGTSGVGTRTLRFEASSSVGPAPCPSPSLAMATASAIRLRGSKSASSLRHGESYGYDEEEEEEEEDYGTSIDVPDSAPADIMGYDDAELEQTTERVSVPPAESGGYEYGSAGRARGASFASTASSSPGLSPENSNAPYEPAEFPFSIERPPLTPLSVTSESSVTMHYTLPDASNVNEDGKGKDATESRGRGESFSSVETDGSAAPRSQSSSTSALTSITTPSPGAHPRTSSVLGANDNDASLSMPAKEATDNVYVHGSPSSSLEYLASPDIEQSVKPMAPLDLRGISNLAEAEALVQRAQQAILASASLPADGPESPDVPLSVQLAAYGEILALERRFARGEKQRELWAMRDDSEGEDVAPAVPVTAKAQLLKEARMSQKRRDVSLRQRGAATGATGLVGSTFKVKGVAKTPKHKRPHTAEGAPQTTWSVNRGAVSPSASVTGADIVGAEGTPQQRPSHIHSHSRSTSTPLHLNKDAEKEKLPDIEIIETIATPVDSPKTPESVAARLSPTMNLPAARYPMDNARPSLPLRSRTPDPEASTDDFSLGVPLTRVSTAPLQDTGSVSGNYSTLRSDPATRRTGGVHKLAKMGFSLEAHHHHHHHHGHHGQNQNQNAYSPASSTGSSRSPSKARFGGIKSLVRGLKGKS